MTLSLQMRKWATGRELQAPKPRAGLKDKYKGALDESQGCSLGVVELGLYPLTAERNRPRVSAETMAAS
jgi:hypothetical protein